MEFTEHTIREVRVNYDAERTVWVETFTDAHGITLFLRSVIPDNSREHLVALYLDAAHKPIGYSIVSSGIANASHAHPREVYQRAVLLGAVAVVIAHNHPSDDTEPSKDDFQATRRIADAGSILGIKLLDSIIFTNRAYRSLRAENPELFTK